MKFSDYFKHLCWKFTDYFDLIVSQFQDTNCFDDQIGVTHDDNELVCKLVSPIRDNSGSNVVCKSHVLS